MNKKQTLVRTFWSVTKTQKKAIEKAAKIHGLSESELVREILAGTISL